MKHGMQHGRDHRRLGQILLFMTSFGFVASAVAESYHFAPAPQQDLNRIFRVDRVTGEMGACAFAIKDETSVGITLCYPAGEGAKAGEPGDYMLVPSSHRQEAGIFRVNRRTGEISICYVRGDQEVVCTAPAR
ncbi:hypothetical protein MCEMSEM23_00810 [Rhabdaerophilaceae bacterium]